MVEGKITRRVSAFGNQIILLFNDQDIRSHLDVIQQAPFKGHKTAMQLPDRESRSGRKCSNGQKVEQGESRVGMCKRVR